MTVRAVLLPESISVRTGTLRRSLLVQCATNTAQPAPVGQARWAYHRSLRIAVSVLAAGAESGRIDG